MTITTTTIDDTDHQTGGVNEPPTPNPEVLERSAGRHRPAVTCYFSELWLLMG